MIIFMKQKLIKSQPQEKLNYLFRIESIRRGLLIRKVWSYPAFKKILIPVFNRYYLCKKFRLRKN